MYQTIQKIDQSLARAEQVLVIALTAGIASDRQAGFDGDQPIAHRQVACERPAGKPQ